MTYAGMLGAIDMMRTVRCNLLARHRKALADLLAAEQELRLHQGNLNLPNAPVLTYNTVLPQGWLEPPGAVGSITGYTRWRTARMGADSATVGSMLDHAALAELAKASRFL